MTFGETDGSRDNSFHLLSREIELRFALYLKTQRFGGIIFNRSDISHDKIDVTLSGETPLKLTFHDGAINHDRSFSALS